MDYLTTEELADEFRTTPETVRYWKHLGKGPDATKVGRRVLYARDIVDKWAAAHRQTTDVNGGRDDAA